MPGNVCRGPRDDGRPELEQRRGVACDGRIGIHRVVDDRLSEVHRGERARRLGHQAGRRLQVRRHAVVDVRGKLGAARQARGRGPYGDAVRPDIRRRRREQDRPGAVATVGQGRKTHRRRDGQRDGVALGVGRAHLDGQRGVPVEADVRQGGHAGGAVRAGRHVVDKDGLGPGERAGDKPDVRVRPAGGPGQVHPLGRPGAVAHAGAAVRRGVDPRKAVVRVLHAQDAARSGRRIDQPVELDPDGVVGRVEHGAHHRNACLLAGAASRGRHGAAAAAAAGRAGAARRVHAPARAALQHPAGRGRAGRAALRAVKAVREQGRRSLPCQGRRQRGNAVEHEQAGKRRAACRVPVVGKVQGRRGGVRLRGGARRQERAPQQGRRVVDVVAGPRVAIGRGRAPCAAAAAAAAAAAVVHVPQQARHVGTLVGAGRDGELDGQAELRYGIAKRVQVQLELRDLDLAAARNHGGKKVRPADHPRACAGRAEQRNADVARGQALRAALDVRRRHRMHPVHGRQASRRVRLASGADQDCPRARVVGRGMHRGIQDHVHRGYAVPVPGVDVPPRAVDGVECGKRRAERWHHRRVDAVHGRRDVEDRIGPPRVHGRRAVDDPGMGAGQRVDGDQIRVRVRLARVAVEDDHVEPAVGPRRAAGLCKVGEPVQGAQRAVRGVVPDAHRKAGRAGAGGVGMGDAQREVYRRQGKGARAGGAGGGGSAGSQVGIAA